MGNFQIHYCEMCAICSLFCKVLQRNVEFGVKGLSSASSPVPLHPSRAVLWALPRASLPASRLSEAISPPTLLLLECAHGASWLHLWVWVNWELSEKKTHDARLRKSMCPLYLLWPNVVYPERQWRQAQCMCLLPGVPPQGSEKQLFREALLIAQSSHNAALKAKEEITHFRVVVAAWKSYRYVSEASGISHRFSHGWGEGRESHSVFYDELNLHFSSDWKMWDYM